MNFNEAVSAVHSLGNRGMNFGLERTRALLDGLGSPDGKLKIIHIAGTNGKGSTAEFITQILIAAGKSVGTFTSPAVYDYCEQFRINGEPIDGELYAKAFGSALKISAGATQFELETAAALYAFVLAGCEYAVVECGLGGTYDATNAILRKEVAVINSVSLEHTGVLGNTLKEICTHKSGIIKGCPAVVNSLQSAEVAAFFEKKNVIITEKPQIICENAFLYGGKEYRLTMKGAAQPYNAACAIEVAKLLKIDETATYMGVYSAFLGGRIEVLTAKDGTLYVLDGAHNPAAFAPLKDYVSKQSGEKSIVFGCLSDKDVKGNAAALAGVANEFFAVSPPVQRAMESDKIYSALKCVCPVVYRAGTVAEALEKSVNKTVAVCGSFTLLKEAKIWIEKKL